MKSNKIGFNPQKFTRQQENSSAVGILEQAKQRDQLLGKCPLRINRTTVALVTKDKNNNDYAQRLRNKLSLSDYKSSIKEVFQK